MTTKYTPKTSSVFEIRQTLDDVKDQTWYSHLFEVDCYERRGAVGVCVLYVSQFMFS